MAISLGKSIGHGSVYFVFEQVSNGWRCVAVYSALNHFSAQDAFRRCVEEEGSDGAYALVDGEWNGVAFHPRRPDAAEDGERKYKVEGMIAGASGQEPFEAGPVWAPSHRAALQRFLLSNDFWRPELDNWRLLCLAGGAREVVARGLGPSYAFEPARVWVGGTGHHVKSDAFVEDRRA